MQITQLWNPSGGGGTYNNHATGVWYNTTLGRWSVFNQNGVAMPAGAAFTVEVRLP